MHNWKITPNNILLFQYREYWISILQQLHSQFYPKHSHDSRQNCTEMFFTMQQTPQLLHELWPDTSYLKPKPRTSCGPTSSERSPRPGTILPCWFKPQAKSWMGRIGSQTAGTSTGTHTGHQHHKHKFTARCRPQHRSIKTKLQLAEYR